MESAQVIKKCKVTVFMAVYVSGVTSAQHPGSSPFKQHSSQTVEVTGLQAGITNMEKTQAYLVTPSQMLLA